MGNPKEQVLFAGRLGAFLDAARESRRLSAAEVARRIGVGKNLLSAYRNPKYQSGPPKPAVRRRLEQAIGVSEGALDRDDPADLKAIKTPLPVKTHIPPPSGHLAGTLEFLREQLDGYRKKNRLVPPEIVAAWFTEMETAAGSTTLVPGGTSRRGVPVTAGARQGGRQTRTASRLVRHSG